MIYLGADHRGFNLKENLKDFLNHSQIAFEDLGANSLLPEDDYPVYATLVAQKIQKNPDSFGILICGSGVGADIAANKFDGIKASIGKSPDQVRAGRSDDDMNILVIAADFTTPQEVQNLVKAFLNTKFENSEKHMRRLNEINAIEDREAHSND